MSQLLNNTTRSIYLANCLYDCIEDNNIRAVKKLLQENEADPNIIIPDKGISPFHLAIGSGNEDTAEEITKMFLGYRGNPNIESVEKLTPVHVAAAWGRLNVLKLLLNCGGDPNLKDEEGKLPLDYAKIENYNEIVDFLQNFMHELNHEPHINTLKYDLTLSKLIVIDNRDIIAEYGSPDLSEPMFDLNMLPKNSTSTYVNNWCIKHAVNNKNDSNNKTLNKDLNLTNSDIDNVEINSLHNYSENFTPGKNYSRESGILTIPGNTSENILNKCIVNSEENTTAYLTCESVSIHDKNIENSLLTLDISESVKHDEIWNITNDKSVINIPCQLVENEKEQSIFSVEEEYKYVDEEEDIVLIEKRILVHPKIDDKNRTTTSNSSKYSSLPSVINYDTDTLRNELTTLGEIPGPITKTTKRVYLKKLKKLQKYTFLNPPIQRSPVNNRVYSVELEQTLRNSAWSKELTSYKALESIVSEQFDKPESNKRWREGITKTSFTYLLLDPRITRNLPQKHSELQPDEIWKTFLSAIFYVGKGKRSRPYSHLYDAVNYWKKGKTKQKNMKKLKYILDIWQNNSGVICLHIFQNVIPVEAYTREAAMINALKLQNLCNSKQGDFYGISATWPERKKRLLGVYLLYRAMLIFLNEGERQLRPDDI